MTLEANADRFSGFAELYDAVRPTPPALIGVMLTRYAGGARPHRVVDLGSGTGLSSRWAATWADEVVGVEPGGDMRARAAASTPAHAPVRYVGGWSHATGLPAGNADVVLAVQALHWMDPSPTFAEAARLLRPGGVFAAIDCDWPPSVGSARAEAAWGQCRMRVKSYEARRAAGVTGDALTAPLTDAERAEALGEHFARDPHKEGPLPPGVQAWSKDGHLARMLGSGRFAFCREVCVTGEERGTANRFVALLRSQGDLQTLVRNGVGEHLLGVDELAAEVRGALGEGEGPFWFTYRVRLGVLAG